MAGQRIGPLPDTASRPVRCRSAASRRARARRRDDRRALEARPRGSPQLVDGPRSPIRRQLRRSGCAHRRSDRDDARDRHVGLDGSLGQRRRRRPPARPRPRSRLACRRSGSLGRGDAPPARRAGSASARARRLGCRSSRELGRSSPAPRRRSAATSISDAVTRRGRIITAAAAARARRRRRHRDEIRIGELGLVADRIGERLPPRALRGARFVRTVPVAAARLAFDLRRRARAAPCRGRARPPRGTRSTANRSALAASGRVTNRSGASSIASSAVRIGPSSSPTTHDRDLGARHHPRAASRSATRASPTSRLAVITTTSGRCASNRSIVSSPPEVATTRPARAGNGSASAAASSAIRPGSATIRTHGNGDSSTR